jgi:proline dehydrogenase
MSTGGRKGKAHQRNMGPLNRVIASSVPFMPKSLVGRVGRRYAAGEEVEDAVRVVEGLAREGCLVTVVMLGEHAPDERHTHERLDEYRRALNAQMIMGV